MAVSSAVAGQLSLSGNDADGYLAVVNFNQEGNTTLDDVNSNPTSSKFFDYPAYVNPLVPTNIYIMAVEPYAFGLDYPDPLFPTGPSTFTGVGELQPRNSDGSAPAGATFVEGFTEDADFNQFDIGTLDYDDSALTGVGTETLAVSEITLNLDGSEFQARNRDPSFQNGDFQSPDGRSNNNEFANNVTITPSNMVGEGLTFIDGVLSSVALTADVQVSVAPAAAPPAFGFQVDGTLTFDGQGFAFDVDGTDSNPFSSNTRILLNRSGTIDFPGLSSLVGDYNGDGFVSQGDLDLVLLNWGDDTLPEGFDASNLDGGGPFDDLVSQNELDGVLLNWGAGTAPSVLVIPEPGVGGLFALVSGVCFLRSSTRRKYV